MLSWILVDIISPTVFECEVEGFKKVEGDSYNKRVHQWCSSMKFRKQRYLKWMGDLATQKGIPMIKESFSKPIHL